MNDKSIKKRNTHRGIIKKENRIYMRILRYKTNYKKWSIRSIEHTNINYIEPHQIFIKGKLYLAFNYSTEIYIKNLGECIPIKELENYIKEK